MPNTNIEHQHEYRLENAPRAIAKHEWRTHSHEVGNEPHEHMDQDLENYRTVRKSGATEQGDQ